MLEIECFTFGPFETNTYVVRHEQHILLIDPACSNKWEQKKLLDYIENLKSQNTNHKLQIVATHGHLDHLWGAKWATVQWKTPVLMHEADIPMAQAMQQQYDLFGIRTKAVSFPVEPLPMNQSIGADLSFLHTPGHTPGSVCLYFPKEKVLFSGDTLFRMGYGRTDLPGGNYIQLMDSLRRLFALPTDVRVYPGHGAPTTISEEK